MGKPSQGNPAAILELVAGGSARPLPRHRHRLSRDEIHESQRARILAAAIKLFSAQGYPATSVLDIAKKAGVSRNTFYELYNTKEDVFLAAYKGLSEFARNVRSLDRQPKNAPAAPEALASRVDTILSALATTPDAVRMFFLEALGAGPRVRAKRNEGIREFVDAAAPYLRDLRAGADPALPELTTQLVHSAIAAVVELITEHLAENDPASLPQLTPQITELIHAIATPNRRRDGNPTAP